MNLKNKNVLVTGGAGFIGSHLNERLLKEAANVTIYDNFSTGKAENIATIKEEMSVISGDIRDYNMTLKACDRQDLVIHEAFPYAEQSRDLSQQYIEDGCVGTYNLLRASLECGVERVIYASSVAVYGEQKYVPLDEEHPKDPILPYGATKLVGEMYCRSFSRIYGLNTIILRYFNVYGPRYATFDHSAMVLFLENVINSKNPIIYGDGTQMRDYTFIDDAIDGTILAAKKEIYGEVFNIGNGNGIQIVDLAEKIIDISGKELKSRFAKPDEYRHFKKGLPYGMTKKVGDKYLDTRKYIANIEKAKKVLGYSPKVNIEDGIRKTLEWMLELEIGGV